MISTTFWGHEKMLSSEQCSCKEQGEQAKKKRTVIEQIQLDNHGVGSE